MGFVPRETFLSLKNEKNFSKRISEIWRCKLTKLGKSYSPDFAIIKNNEVVAFLELKCRYGQNWDKFSTYMVAYKKWEKCISHCNTHLFTFPLILAVAVDDGDYWCNITKLDKLSGVKVRMGGRSDRDWEEDQEPCVFIPKVNFNKFIWKKQVLQ